jgi:hypothetical protein
MSLTSLEWKRIRPVLPSSSIWRFFLANLQMLRVQVRGIHKNDEPLISTALMKASGVIALV